MNAPEPLRTFLQRVDVAKDDYGDGRPPHRPVQEPTALFWVTYLLAGLLALAAMLWAGPPLRP